MYCPKCSHEMDNIEDKQPNCNFTINEGDAEDTALSRLFLLVTKVIRHSPVAQKRQNWQEHIIILYE
jgi:hypothetical protein